MIVIRVGDDVQKNKFQSLLHMSNHERIFIYDKDSDKIVSGHYSILVDTINEKKENGILSREMELIQMCFIPINMQRVLST